MGKKIISEDSRYFYLYNPIPIIKQEDALVIQNILKSKKITYVFGEDVDLNEMDAVNKMRFKDYINRVVKYTEVRGHAIEGLMAGLFDGVLNESKSGLWDYQIRQGQVEQKYINDASENPSIGSFTSLLNQLGGDNIAIIKNVLNNLKFNGTNIFLVNDNELTEFKKQILESMLVDITAVTTKVGNDLVTYYLTKNQAIELFSDAENIYNPRKKGSNELRVSFKTFSEFGNSFKITIPSINQKEYDEFLTISSDEMEISKIFGPFSNKIRPDILNWIVKNKEQFKQIVNDLL
jgi:ferredoxin-fold anticodon binding domain-containing protein